MLTEDEAIGVVEYGTVDGGFLTTGSIKVSRITTITASTRLLV